MWNDITVYLIHGILHSDRNKSTGIPFLAGNCGFLVVEQLIIVVYRYTCKCVVMGYKPLE